ncbi:MAG TPA: hybrid sensor histidine kinase/response regulator [Holophaga sp.]|nr:hybrid sensor histidine kinase/response regulator [Holophaga sp.]
MASDWTGETILVVDDDRNTCLALSRQLLREDYQVICLHDGAEALAFARTSRADLVILDLVMPGMGGIEACRGLRATEGWEHTPVLILTGTDMEEAYAQALGCGADDFLTKPVRREELLLRVKSLIRSGALVEDLKSSVATIEHQKQVILQARELQDRLQAFLLHDLKNPISSILLQAEMMVGREDAHPGWGRVLASSEHLMKLVLSWMDHIKAEHAGLKPDLAEVEVAPFLSAILARHELWLRSRGVRGEVAADAALRHPMDGVLMDRVLSNLVDNCLRYAPEGSVLGLGAERDGSGSLRLWVSDQGPGVPEADRGRLFDLYVQLEASAGHASGRHTRGLGLAYCRAAVESHGGRIWVDDNPGGGSRFHVELPEA